MKIRRLTAIALALLVAAALILTGCEPSKSKTGESYGDLYYSVDENEVTINACDESATGKLSIPKKIDGKPVTAIRTKAFEGCDKLTEVTVPDCVEYMGDEVFSQCTALQTITIGDGVESLDKFAFYHCTNLQKIVLGAGMKNIYGGDDYDYEYASYHQSSMVNEWLFYGNTALAWVEVSEENRYYSTRDGVLYDKEQTTLIYCPEAKQGTVTIPATVEEISFDVLKRCLSLQEVAIDAAHTAYTSIDGVVYSKGVRELLYCPIGKQGAITIPDSVYLINWEELRDCIALTAVHVGAGNAAYASEDGVVYNKEKTALRYYPYAKSEEYTLPAAIQDVDFAIFGGCAALTAIHVDTANAAYTSVDGVVYSKDLTRLWYCPEGKAGAYTIPDTVKNVEDGALENCDALTSVTIGDGIYSVKDFFSTCDNLEKIVLGAGVNTIFFDSYGGYFDGCDALTTIEVDKDNSHYSAKDGVLFNKEQTVLLRYPQAKQGAYTVPEGVQEIGPSAFAQCAGLTAVTVADSITKMGQRAFFNCKALEEATLGSGITLLEDWVFSQCSALKTLTLTKSVKQVGFNVFSSCESLTDVYYGGTRGDRKQIRSNYDTDLQIGPLASAKWHYANDTQLLLWAVIGCSVVVLGVALMLFLLLKKKKSAK